jgi:hypothetical protein
MISMLTVLASVALACLAGYGARYLPIKPYGQSLAALAAGWFLASVVLVLAWLRWPPSDIGVVAVAVGLREFSLTAIAVILGGVILHAGISYLERRLPGLGRYRTMLMSTVGGLVAVFAFTVETGGVHPLR